MTLKSFDMKLLLRILLLITVILWTIGGIKFNNNHSNGQFFVGIGVTILAFVMMPLFIFHRYRKKDLSQYSLHKENK